MKAYKLSKDQRIYALRLVAEGVTYKETADKIYENFKIKIDRHSIEATCKTNRWSPIVRQFREQYVSKLRDIPIFHKRMRLDKLQKEVDRISEKIEELDFNEKEDRVYYIQLVEKLRQNLDSARLEIDQKPFLIQNTHIEFNELSDEELHDRKRHLIREVQRSIESFGGKAQRASSDQQGFEGEDQAEPSEIFLATPEKL